MVALMLTGCLVPMPIEEETAAANSPPTYAFGQAQPPPNQVVRYDPESADTTVEFRINAVEDLNPDDRIFYRWFINYAGSGLEQEGPSGGRSPEQRDLPISLQVNPCARFQGDAADPNGNNRIELIVADRPFISREDQEDPTAPGGDQVLPDDARSFRVTWFLRFVAEDGAGACPN